MNFSSQQVGDLIDTSVHEAQEAIINAVLACNWHGFESFCEIDNLSELRISVPASHMSKAKEIADFFFAARSVHEGAEYAFSSVSVSIEGIETRCRERIKI